MAKRVTSIGGQALLEGILMVGPKKNVAAFCDEAGNITTEEVSTPSLREKYPILKKPFIRGVFSMVDTLRLGMKALTLSADKVGGEEEEEPSKFEKWLEKKFGDKVMNAVVAVFLSTPSGWRATAKTDKVFVCFCAKGRRICLFKTRKEKNLPVAF